MRTTKTLSHGFASPQQPTDRLWSGKAQFNEPPRRLHDTGGKKRLQEPLVFRVGLEGEFISSKRSSCVDGYGRIVLAAYFVYQLDEDAVSVPIPLDMNRDGHRLSEVRNRYDFRVIHKSGVGGTLCVPRSSAIFRTPAGCHSA